MQDNSRSTSVHMWRKWQPKKNWQKYGVEIAFTAPNKLLKLAQRQNKSGKRNSQDNTCNTQHRTSFVVECSVHVVYRTPFPCDAVYVGQMERCLNTRLRELSSSLRAVPSGHLALHVRDCRCIPIFHDNVVLQNQKRTARKPAEAFHIHSIGNQACTSSPSLFLYSNEHKFFKKGERRPINHCFNADPSCDIWHVRFLHLLFFFSFLFLFVPM